MSSAAQSGGAESETSHTGSAAQSSLNICVAGNFTAEPIEEVLAYWLAELGIRARIRFAPYNQVFQQLLEGGLLRSNRGGINLICLDLDDWLAQSSTPEAFARLDQAVEDLVATLQASGSVARGVVLLFPPEANRPADQAAAVASARGSMLEGCSSIPGWSAIDLAGSVSLYSVLQTRDTFTDRIGHIPFTEEMYAAAATVAARWMRSALTKPRKVIALDCDNTLWQGICGEGPVQVTSPFRRLQEFMVKRQESGILLTLLSKNNEADVMAVLQSDDCVLRTEHLTSWRINWEPKSRNLQELSEELGLALNTFIFLDDSSYECMEVRSRHPEVMVIQMPSDPQEAPAFLDHLWVFDSGPATEEDRNRTEMYRADRQRAELSRRVLTREEFLRSLCLEIRTAPAVSPELVRVAQLTQRTTQFNMTGTLHTEQSLSILLATGRHECWTVHVRDIFGDYGLVGVLLLEIAGDTLRVNGFLLSCRALGRGVEDTMVEKLRSRAIANGAEKVVIPVVPTARNRPAREFLNRLCGAPIEGQEPFECVLSAATEISEWRPADVPTDRASALPAKGLPVFVSEEGAILRIAASVRTASDCISAARAPLKQRSMLPAQFGAPRNEIEDAVARIWSECLRVEPIGVADSFFDLGGTSLAGTRVLARARSAFGVELSLTEFCECATVEGMAARIAEKRPVGQSSAA